MTIDVNVHYADKEFLDDIDEIIEDTMVQIFILHPKDKAELERAQEQANEHNPLFYAAPLSLLDHIDSNCVALHVDSLDTLLASQHIQKPLFIKASILDRGMLEILKQKDYCGVILDATELYEELEKFHISIGPDNIEKFDPSILEKLSMQKIVLHSAYPDYGFDEIFETSKKISDIIFRPDPSIIAAATQNTLHLFDFK